MGGWLLIWILFIAGFFPLGLGIYLLVNKKLRADREQRRAGIVSVIIGLVMLSPILWMEIYMLIRHGWSAVSALF